MSECLIMPLLFSSLLGWVEIEMVYDSSYILFARYCFYVANIVLTLMWMAGNPRVTPEVTRDVCLLARMMAANLYYAQIEDLMFEVKPKNTS
jgi:hypothetical protein